MEMCACGIVSCVADEGDRGTCCDLVSNLLQQFLVVLIDGDDVAFVLDLDGVPRVVVPSGIYHGTIQGGFDY